MKFLYLFPLQSLQEFNISSYTGNPVHSILFVIGFILIIAIIIFLNTSKKVQQSNAFSTGKVGAFTAKTPEDETYKKIARMYELKKEEAAFLRELFSSTKSDPEEVLEDIDALDAIFKQNYQRLAKDAERSKEAMRNLGLLFSTRNAIAYFQGGDENKNDANKVSHRFHLRKSISASCACNVVALRKTSERGKTVKKFQLTDKMFAATVMDVSAGGCAVTCEKGAKPGTQLKVEFKVGRFNVAALGQILRINSGEKGAILHIQFLKVPPKALSILNAYVHGYL